MPGRHSIQIQMYVWKAKNSYYNVQWWFVKPDMFVPGRYFRINKFSGLLNCPLVRTRKSVPALFVRISETIGLSEPGLTYHHCTTLYHLNKCTGKPVLTDTRDRRTLAHNGQFLKVPNIFFIFYCILPCNKQTLPYPYNGQCLWNQFSFIHTNQPVYYGRC